MLRRLYILLFAVSGLLSVTGCAVYSSQLADVAVLEEKGDAQVSANFGAFSGLGASATYAATDHFAVQASGAFVPNEPYDQNDLRVSAGYYNAFENHTMLALYAGYDLGTNFYKADRELTNGYKRIRYHYNYDMPMLQLDYGIRPAKWFECGIRLTGGYMWATLEKHTIEENSEGIPGPESITHENTRGMLLEPALVLRLGCNNLKFDIKGSLTLYPNENNFYYNEMNVGIGISYRFNPMKKKYF